MHKFELRYIIKVQKIGIPPKQSLKKRIKCNKLLEINELSNYLQVLEFRTG